MPRRQVSPSLLAQEVGVLACSLAHPLEGRAQPELLLGEGQVMVGGVMVVRGARARARVVRVGVVHMVVAVVRVRVR